MESPFRGYASIRFFATCGAERYNCATRPDVCTHPRRFVAKGRQRGGKVHLRSDKLCHLSDVWSPHVRHLTVY